METNSANGIQIKFIFAWYDLWIGFFWDAKKKWLYFFPIPMFGLIVKFKEPKRFNMNDPKQPWNLRTINERK